MSVQEPSSYPSSNTSAPGGAQTAVPQRVNTAFWLYIAAAALSLIALIVSLSTVDTLRASVEERLQQQGTEVSGATIDAAVGAGVTASVVFGLLYLAAYVLFAFFVRRGANWARIVLLVVTALSLIEVFSGYGLGAVRVALGIVATVLVFTGTANEYFRSRKSRSAA